MAQQLPRSRPAHPNGPTYAAYTPDGTKLVTVGLNTTAKIFEHSSDAEPGNIDECHDMNLAVIATDTSIITGSEDGVVARYSLESKDFDRMLVRCSLPIRDLALSPNGKWVAVASDEVVVKVVHVESREVIYVRDQPKAVKHVSWCPTEEQLLTVSCTDGSIYAYEFRDQEALLLKRLPALIKAYESDADQTTRAVWHPDGKAFAVPLPTRDIQIISAGDWEAQRVFRNGHTGDITAIAWSPNGALLATAGLDRTIQIWDSSSQKTLTSIESVPGAVTSLSWHPSNNVLSYTSNTGELFIHSDILPEQHRDLLRLSLQKAPFIHDPLSEVSGNAQRRPTDRAVNGKTNGLDAVTDPLDDILADTDEEEDFIVDDDGQGYAEPAKANGHKKRSNGHLDGVDSRATKRRPAQDNWQPRLHPAFQPGSTPWRGSRRYLTINLVGSIETVDNYESGDDNKYHSITIDFWDYSLHKKYLLTDHRFYDKACLDENGALFSCPPSEDGVTPSVIYYHPHESWTMNRPDFNILLPEGERVSAMSLSTSFITIVTTANYVRVYTLYGVPYRVYRQKSCPAVASASYGEYVFTVGNGPLTGTGRPQLTYTIENIKRDDVLQSDDIVALPDNEDLKNVFFSDEGDPYIFDSTGTLLVLLHWRTPGQARWVPVLDTKQLDGPKNEKYWPVGVSSNKFYCIGLRGVDSPHHQQHLLMDFDFCIPTSGRTEIILDEDIQTVRKLEEAFVRESIVHALLEDMMPLDDKSRTSSQRSQLVTQELAINRALLQLLNNEVNGGEDHGPKALEMVNLLRDGDDGRFLDAAKKIVQRKQLNVLEDKITALQERRAAERGGWAL